MFHWNKPVPERKPITKFKPKKTGEFKNFITVEQYAKKYKIIAQYIYQVLIPNDRVDWRIITGIKLIDKRYPPFLYTPKKKRLK